MKITQYAYTLWSLFVFGVFMLAAVPVFMLAGLAGNIGRLKTINAYTKLWARTWRKLTGLGCQVHGRENINLSASYVFVINHTSMTDAVLLCESMDNLYAPLAKKEIAGMPVLGRLIKYVAVYVDRSSKESRKGSMAELKRQAERGLSLVIFPEGTRNGDPNLPLAPFYSGAFQIAVEMQLPIVPLIFVGARSLFTNERLPLNRTGFECHFMPAVETKGLSEADVDGLKAKVHGLMESKVMELGGGKFKNP